MNSTDEFKTIITKEHDLDSPLARIQNESHLSSMSINMTGSPILNDQQEQTPLFIHQKEGGTPLDLKKLSKYAEMEHQVKVMPSQNNSKNTKENVNGT